ncbi:hypothetical protein FRX31_020107 [Thalictrum thalictroides]|uniref:Uncharacterized protein n=1 Tax=Thalictrum thalictroides TaxID=46969 RepID=A0A7J6VYV6_THATH|nr:hypothetical protein FRX31_020107 [Thalictrum thalictroides]
MEPSEYTPNHPNHPLHPVLWGLHQDNILEFNEPKEPCAPVEPSLPLAVTAKQTPITPTADASSATSKQQFTLIKGRSSWASQAGTSSKTAKRKSSSGDISLKNSFDAIQKADDPMGESEDAQAGGSSANLELVDNGDDILILQLNQQQLQPQHNQLQQQQQEHHNGEAPARGLVL